MDLLKRTWAEIDLDHLEYNYHQLRGYVADGCRFLGVVKADAYGHGAVQVSHTLEELGADYLAVSNLEEAVQLRRAAVRLPVLLLGYTPPRYAAEMAQMNVHQEIHSLEYAQRLSQRLEGTGLRLPVHWKVDTGMSRLGVSAEDPAKALDELLQIASLPNLAPTGVFTHFSVADSLDPADQAYTQGQFARFQAVCQGLADAGYCNLIRHCANSGATIQYPDYALDMIRPGIATYGLSPEPALADRLPLRPVMTLRTTVSQVREYEAGTYISYGRTYCTPAPRRVAVLPIGYADGLPRRLSNRVSFLVGGKQAPVIGRICMDMCMVDVSEAGPVGVGDEVVVFGPVPGANRCDDLAAQLDTISYELTCDINKRMTRLYFQGGRQVGILQYIV